MRKIRDVLRLRAGGMSKRKIAASLGVSPTAAGECMRRARRVGLGWPLPEDMTDEALESRLYPPPASPAKDQRPQPDWPRVDRELRRPGVTLQLLWEEHRAVYPDGYGYSRVCELYRVWVRRLSPTKRQCQRIKLWVLKCTVQLPILLDGVFHPLLHLGKRKHQSA
jgi:hypothetical protein